MAIMVDLVCEYCGKTFEVYPYRSNKRFCSRKCYDSFRKNKVLTRQCKNCGNDFKLYESDLKNKNRIYCSQKCYREYKMKSGIYNKGIYKHCLYCNKLYYVYRHKILSSHFCSYKCRSAWRSEHIVGKNHWQYNKVDVKCVACGKTYSVTPSHIKTYGTRFCSKECKFSYLRGENSHAWKGGISFNPYCERFNSEFKNRVREYFGNKCVLCGKNKEENSNKNMCVHHVLYDKKICCNDVPRLFVTLCRSCHSKTNGNREYWVLKFEHIIHAYYNDKCYYTKVEFDNLKNEP